VISVDSDSEGINRILNARQSTVESVLTTGELDRAVERMRDASLDVPTSSTGIRVIPANSTFIDNYSEISEEECAAAFAASTSPEPTLADTVAAAVATERAVIITESADEFGQREFSFRSGSDLDARVIVTSLPSGAMVNIGDVILPLRDWMNLRSVKHRCVLNCANMVERVEICVERTGETYTLGAKLLVSHVPLILSHLSRVLTIAGTATTTATVLAAHGSADDEGDEEETVGIAARLMQLLWPKGI
jgi:hypothetical protein